MEFGRLSPQLLALKAIKFKGAAGEKTDGGAINTLAAEEIAVAAAKRLDRHSCIIGKEI